MSTSGTPRIAKAQAKRSRARLMNTLGMVRHRLSPSTLTHDAVTTVKENARQLANVGADRFRSNPALVAALVMGVGIYLLRHWLPHPWASRDETADADMSLNDQPAQPDANEGTNP